VLVLCAIIAVILMPTLVFLRVMALGMVANAVILDLSAPLYGLQGMVRKPAKNIALRLAWVSNGSHIAVPALDELADHGAVT